MTPLKDTIKNRLKQDNGFSLIELMVVIVIIAILASIGIINFRAFRAKAYDAVALADARNFIDSAVMATLNNEDVLYQTGAAGAPLTGPLGNEDTSNNPRPPVFVISNGVVAEITEVLGGSTLDMQADIYHVRGSGRRFSCSVDEESGMTVLP